MFTQPILERFRGFLRFDEGNVAILNEHCSTGVSLESGWLLVALARMIMAFRSFEDQWWKYLNFPVKLFLTLDALKWKSFVPHILQVYLPKRERASARMILRIIEGPSRD